jgi:transcriptional regulator with XRE-family HTH domain
MSPKRLGRVIKALREKKGWTQDMLAKRAKLTKPYISQLESGVRKNPSLPALQRLAKALGSPLWKLLK